MKNVRRTAEAVAANGVDFEPRIPPRLGLVTQRHYVGIHAMEFGPAKSLRE